MICIRRSTVGRGNGPCILLAVACFLTLCDMECATVVPPGTVEWFEHACCDIASAHAKAR
jgi:hypothetical protein